MTWSEDDGYQGFWVTELLSVNSTEDLDVRPHRLDPTGQTRREEVLKEQKDPSRWTVPVQEESRYCLHVLSFTESMENIVIQTDSRYVILFNAPVGVSPSHPFMWDVPLPSVLPHLYRLVPRVDSRVYVRSL